MNYILSFIGSPESLLGLILCVFKISLVMLIVIAGFIPLMVLAKYLDGDFK